MGILNIVLMVITVFASFKLANEKGQHTLIWPMATAFLGVIVFIVQYLVSIYAKPKNLV